MHPVAAVPCRFVIWITTGMRPREWVAVHRKHHAATDTEEDPHSPLVVGFWRVQLGNVGLYKRVASDKANTRKYARDIPHDRIDKLAFDYAARRSRDRDRDPRRRYVAPRRSRCGSGSSRPVSTR